MIEVLKLQSARYLKNGWIDAILTVRENGNVIEGWPYTASPDDESSFSRGLFELLKSEKLGAVSSYTDEDAANDEKIERENKKGAMLSEADKIIRVLSDEHDAGIISDDDLARWKAWIVYRKALRELDVTATDIKLPDKPE